MSYVDDYHIEMLERELMRKQRINRLFSIRSYARFLGISQSSLTQILKRKRRLPHRHAERVVDILGLNPQEKKNFLESVLAKAIRLSTQGADGHDGEQKELSEAEHYQVIAEWEHLAVLSLTETKDFKSDLDWIAKRLGITRPRAEGVVQRLLKGGLLKVDEQGRYQQEYLQLTTTKDIPSEALKDAQLENCDLGKAKYLETPLEKKYYGSTTLAINPKRLPQAKELIRNFRKSLAEFVETGDKEEVYQLVVQFYPLSVDGEEQ